MTKRAKTAPRKAASKKRAPAKKTPPKTIDTHSADERLLPGANEVIVRMYRHGLGDCFLLAFSTPDPAEPRYVLVDCGVHSRQREGTDRLNQVMNQLVKAVGGHLHVVVATHEHADHLSGFVQKGSPFRDGRLTVGEFWAAWTEKRGHPLADRLREKHGIAREILDAAVKKAASEGMPGIKSHIEQFSDFEDPAPDGFDTNDRSAVLAQIRTLTKEQPERAEVLAGLTQASAAGLTLGVAKKKKEPSSNELAIGLLALLAKSERYGKPGTTLSIPDVDGARAYVLGPPLDEKLLKKDLPTKVRGGGEHDYQETYLSAHNASQSFARSPALGQLSDGGSFFRQDVQYPFVFLNEYPTHYGWDLKTLKALDSKKLKDDRTGAELSKFLREFYFDPEHSWRCIDDEWLRSGEQLALDLDSDTNNTSLALALELGTPGKGPVLLFPGDAQVGNWLSWRDQKYGNNGAKFTADDLLSRTLLYKVGHHGSHNATLKNDPRNPAFAAGEPYGLELMDEIIAMIPVDRDAADRNMPTPWRMPHLPLYERLREKAARRVLRADRSLKPLRPTDPADLRPAKAVWGPVPGKPGIEWRESTEEFEKGTKGSLFVEIRISNL